MHGEQLHRTLLRGRRHLDGAALQGAHKVVGRGVARAIQHQRLRQHGVNGVQRRKPLFGRHAGRHALAQFALVHDAVQQVVRRQSLGIGIPALHQALRALQCGTGVVGGNQGMPPIALCTRAFRERGQVIVAGAEQRAAQGVRQRKPVARG